MKSDKHRHFLALILFVLGIALTIGGAAVLTTAAESGTFSVSVEVTNAAPQIVAVASGFSVQPVDNTTVTQTFYFNVTDGNGVADLNDSTAVVVISQGSQSNQSASCSPTDVPGNNQVNYACDVGIPYYFDNAAFTINASVEDNTASHVENASETFTVLELRAILLSDASLAWTTVSPGTADADPAEGPMGVFNTGNYDFPSLNLTGINLNGSSTGDILGVGNFTVNVTNSGEGQALVNNSPVNIVGVDMSHGAGAIEQLYIKLDLPSSVQPDTYNSQSDWTIQAWG